MTTGTQTDRETLLALDDELNRLIVAGKALDGFEKFYADDVVMQENTEQPTVGKDANRRRETEFFDSVAEFHGARVLANAAADDVTFSEWVFEVTFENGQHLELEQTAVRRWRDGKIVHERFYYNAA